MFGDFTKALGQLGDPRLRNAIVLSAIASLLLIAALGMTIWVLLDSVALLGGWFDDVLAWLGALAVLVLGLLFFPGASNAICGLFLDSVSAAVEARHYPDLGPARSQPIGEALAGSVRFLAVSIALNLVLLPVYILAPGLNLVIFYGANGYLMGREYFEMVAARRMPAAEARELRQRRAGSVWFSGVLIAVVTTVPILNLAGPVIGTALMLHTFERLRKALGK